MGELLRQSGERESAAIAAAALGVWDWDMTVDVVRFDATWFSQLGCPPQPGNQPFEAWGDRVHPEDLERSLELIRRHVSGLTTTYENLHRLRHADGSWRWILARGAIVKRDDAGRPLRFIGTHLDVTESEQARQLLAREHAQLARLVALMPVPVALLDRELRYLAASDAWLRQHPSADPGPVVGAAHAARCPDDDARWRAILLDALAGFSRRGERDPFFVGERPAWFRWEATPWVVDGSVEGVLFTREDVTRLVENERASVEEARRNATIELIAGLAHEINNPLEVIHLAAELIGVSSGGTAPPIQAATARIVEAASRVGGLVAALQRLAHPPADTPPEDLPLAPLLERALAPQRARMRRQGVALRIDLAGLHGARVRVHPRAVIHAIQQLVDNALRAMADAPAPWLAVSARRADGAVVLGVEDAGAPVGPDQVDSLFLPFGAGRSCGRGLGLAIVREQLAGGGAHLVHIPRPLDAQAGARFELSLPDVPRRLRPDGDPA